MLNIEETEAEASRIHSAQLNQQPEPSSTTAINSTIDGNYGTSNSLLKIKRVQRAWPVGYRQSLRVVLRQSAQQTVDTKGETSSLEASTAGTKRRLGDISVEKYTENGDVSELGPKVTHMHT